MDNFSAKDTILLVDDEEIVLDVSTLMINRLGYNVRQATNGAEASQIFRDNVELIRLVILDMKLPDEFGSDTCKRLKEIRPDLKIIHTSGIGRVRGGDSLECGCDRFLLKPFKIEVLSNTLRNLLVNTGCQSRPKPK